MQKRKFLYIGSILYVILIYAITVIEQGHPDANIKSFSDGIWFSIVTLTTVGYGDFYPVTIGGKIISLTIILGSLGVLGYLIGELTYKINAYMDKKKRGHLGTDFENHYVIIGWNDFAKQVANQIYNAGHKIALVTNNKNDMELFQNLYSDKTSFVLFTDYQNTDDFNKVNITDSKSVFINFEEDTETLIFVLNIKRVFPDLHITIQCNNSDLRATLENSGVSHVVARQEVTSCMVASYLFEPHVAEYASDLIATSLEHRDHDIQQFRISGDAPYCNASYLDTFIKMKREINTILIGLVVDGKLRKDPADDYIIKEGDYIIVISRGDNNRLNKILGGIKEGY